VNIVQVCGYYPPHLGGIEYCVQHIAEQLVKNGHDVTVCTSSIGAERGHEKRRGLTVFRLRSFEFAHTPFTPSLLFKLWRVDRRSLMHLHLSHVFSEVTVFIVAKVRRMPYVAHFHMDVDVSGRFGFLFRLYKRTILPFVVRGAARVITLSDEQRDLVVNRYKVAAGKVRVIPNGVSETFFVSKKRQYKPPIKLLFVGRFALQKNIPRLLKALPLMKQPVELHLVGDGEKRVEIEQLIQDLGLKNVVMHGRLSGKKLARAYAEADIFVVPSNREGMPLTVLEAAAAGLPIVASSVQGLREFIGDVGVLVSKPSPETFARELNKLIDNPERLNELSSLSQAWAKAHAWPKLVRHIEQLYAEVRNDF
jgi:glycosyltransferase involved in cell wall biosynthesis